MRSNTIQTPDDFDSADPIDVAVRGLVFSERHNYGTVVSTPMMFPSGGGVVVQVTGGDDQFLVSDMGLALHEAEMMGCSTRMFREQASSIAADSGISFDHHAFFLAKATSRQLRGAIKLVANCALRAVHVAAYRMSERGIDGDGAELYERLVQIFGKRYVAKDVKFSGISTHPWPVKARVDADGRVALFEIATTHHTSVVNVAAKFGDIARLDSAPQRITVVKSRKAFGDYLGVLTQSSAVIESDSPQDTYQRLVAA